MTRCPEKCKRQQKSKQEKSKQPKQKKEEEREKMLGQLGRRAKHFKSLGNPKSIVWEITELYTYLQEILREQNCYDTVKSKMVIFFIYSSEFYIGFYFEFTFLLLY